MIKRLYISAAAVLIVLIGFLWFNHASSRSSQPYPAHGSTADPLQEASHMPTIPHTSSLSGASQRVFYEPQSASAQDGKHILKLQSGVYTLTGSVEDNLEELRNRHPEARRDAVLLTLDNHAAQPRIEKLGVQFDGVLPERVYIATLPRALDVKALKAAGVRWVGSLQEQDKLSDSLRNNEIQPWALDLDGNLGLSVRYIEGFSPEELIHTLEEMSARVIQHTPLTGRMTVRVPPASLTQLASIPAVRWIEQATPPDADENDGARFNAQAGAVQSAPYLLNGTNIVLGIWESGDVVDTNHSDFAGRLILAETNTTDNHATHVAGTMAGDGTRSIVEGGSALQWRGMAPGATIVSWDTIGRINEHQAGIEIYDIDLSQNSWGFTVDGSNCGDYGNYQSYCVDYDRIIRGLYGKKIPVVFSAGNDRNDGDCVTDGSPDYFNYGNLTRPKAAKNALVVGAIYSDTDAMTTFSSWGPVDDGRLKPDLVTSGDEAGGEGAIRSTITGNGYGLFQGTSMSAPALSGCIALLMEDWQAYYGASPLPHTIKALLLHTAEDLDGSNAWFNPGPDYASGYGALRIQHAIDQHRAGGVLLHEVADGATNTYSLEVAAGAANVKVTLAWDDEPGAEQAAVELVNDLDLVIYDPAGTRHYPWTLDPAAPSNAAVQVAEDHLNVVEQVLDATTPVTGIWTVQVVGYHVPINSPQDYTLAFSPQTIEPPIDHYWMSPIAPSQQQFEAFSVTMEARDSLNRIVTSQTQAVSLTGRIEIPDSNTLLITEAITGTDAIELQNMSTNTLNLSGWSVSIYDDDGSSWPTPVTNFTIPAGTLCPPGDLFTIDESGTAPGTYPSFSINENIFWTDSTRVALLLRDAMSNQVDFMCAAGASPTDISAPETIHTGQWTGAAIPAQSQSSYSYQRTGGADNHNNTDWTEADSSAGTTNTGLIVPFTKATFSSVSISPTNTGLFTNGVWSGSVAVLSAAAHMHLIADDSEGHTGISTTFSVYASGGDIMVTKSAASSLAAGALLNYTITVTNISAVTVSNVMIQDTLSFGMVYISASSTVGTCVFSNRTLTCQLGHMHSGDAAEMTLTVRPLLTGHQTNLAYMAGADSITSNNQDVAVTLITTPPDSDSDGLPDWWETQHFNSATAANAADDDDNDGENNQQEYLALTSPTNQLSVLELLTFSSAGSSNMLTFDTSEARYYQLSTSTALDNPAWSNLTPLLEGDGEIQIISDTPSGTPQIYRLEVFVP